MDSHQSETVFKQPGRIAIIGSRGMLGQDLSVQLTEAGFIVIGLTRPQLDITNAARTVSCLNELSPDLVINCAAYTAVDKAESESALAFAVNRDGPAHLAEACKGLKIPLIHISTDYVFDGQSGKAYREEDKASPLNVYGESKWEGERAIRSRWEGHLIVRTSWLYGIHGSNFVKTILSLTRERTQIRVVSDQYGSPTWTGDLASALVKITCFFQKDSHKIPWGTYHFCGMGQTSWYGFAEAIVQEARRLESLQVTELVPIGSRDYPAPARRPANSTLDCGKIRQTFGIRPLPWVQALKAMMKQLYQGHVIPRGNSLK